MNKTILHLLWFIVLSTTSTVQAQHTEHSNQTDNSYKGIIEIIQKLKNEIANNDILDTAFIEIPIYQSWSKELDDKINGAINKFKNKKPGFETYGEHAVRDTFFLEYYGYKEYAYGRLLEYDFYPKLYDNFFAEIGDFISLLLAPQMADTIKLKTEKHFFRSHLLDKITGCWKLNGNFVFIIGYISPGIFKETGETFKESYLLRNHSPILHEMLYRTVKLFVKYLNAPENFFQYFDPDYQRSLNNINLPYYYPKEPKSKMKDSE